MALRPTETRATTAGKWLLALVTPASALALGSLPLEVLIAVSGLAALSCGLLWLDPAPRTSRASQWVLVALALLLAMTILQAVPLPASWCRVLSPANADIWDRALTPLREPGPAWHPLSVAPPATRVQVLRGLFYACVFLGALRVAPLEHGHRFLVRLIVASGALMAFAALAHTAVSADRLFGIYHPREAYAYRPGHLAPLLNTNHLAAYLGIGACVAFGALIAKSSMPRALSGSMAVILAATSLLPSSRGATGALVFGLTLTLALSLYTKRRFQSARASTVIIAATGAAATIIVAIALSDTREHLLSRDFVKVDAARRSLGLVASTPWFGFGRGAFETVFVSVRPGADYVTWTNPEDIVIQWLVEWGVPVTIAGFVLLGWALRPQALLGAVRPMVGPWAAIVATVLHELVDYHLEVPGIVALVAICAALATSGAASSSSKAWMAPTWMIRAAPFVAAAGAFVAMLWVSSDINHALSDERRTLSAKAVDKSLSSEEFRDDIRASMLRYPGEPFLPLMGAVRAQTVDGGSVVPWVGRALERNPRYGRAHLVLARSLAARNPSQARLEYRLAYDYDSALRNPISKEALGTIDGATSALELVPDGESGLELLDALVVAVGERLPSTAVMLDEEMERRAPASLAPVRRRVDAAVADVTTDAPWCAGANAPGCMTAAMAAADELVRREPDKCASHLPLARLRVKAGETKRALDDLDRASHQASDRPACLRALVMLALANGQPSRGDAVLDQLVRGGCGATAECSELYDWAGSTEEQRGHYVRAVHLYRRILEVAPDRTDEILTRIGALGDRDGLLAEGLDAYRTLSLRHPEDERWPARITELSGRVQQRGPHP